MSQFDNKFFGFGGQAEGDKNTYRNKQKNNSKNQSEIKTTKYTFEC
jgi:hypothetical protein